jgi:hypothetical protein
MELLEGETLRGRLDAGALLSGPWTTLQIAGALRGASAASSTAT